MTDPSAPPRFGSIRNRHSDVEHTEGAHSVAAAAPAPRIAQVLPPVDWSAIGHAAPERLPLGVRRPEDPLPNVDIVVLTWTSAEWFALDRVFVNSDKAGDFFRDHDWKRAWSPYARGASDYTAGLKSGALWGSFQLVQIADRSGRAWRVLLFKSNSHLAHPPWIDGLGAMLRHILEDTRADRIYTIGTAGGARPSQRLGDSVITNAAQLVLRHPENTGDPDNGSTHRCSTWYPTTALLADVERTLLFELDQVVTSQSLAELFTQLQAEHPGDPGVGELELDDLLTDALRPGSLDKPRVEALKDVPLLTTDFYYIASGDSADAYAFLEMDDAIIAREANKAGVRFACVRNISDPVVPERTGDDQPISAAVRADWSGLIYTSFGLFTSYNGALATWATIAGDGEPSGSGPSEVVP